MSNRAIKKPQADYYYLSEVNSEKDVEILRVGFLRDRDLKVTKAMLDQMVENFKSNTYGTELAVNFNHSSSAAAGWITDIYVEGNSLMAKVEWTKLGRENIEDKLYKFVSIEFCFKYPHHKSGELIDNVVIGLALTNTPALKGQAALMCSENLTNYLTNTTMEFQLLSQAIDSLAAKENVSDSEFQLLEAMLVKAEDSMEDDEVMKDLKKKMEAIKKKMEARKKELEMKKKEKMEEEKREKMTLSEQNQELSERVKTQESQLAELLAEKQERELQETMNKVLLSEIVNTGFVNNSENTQELKSFLSTLNAAQREAFVGLMGKIQQVELGARGANVTPSSVPSGSGDKIDHDAVKKEAEQLSASSGKSLKECLSEIYQRLEDQGQNIY